MPSLVPHFRSKEPVSPLPDVRSLQELLLPVDTLLRSDVSLALVRYPGCEPYVCMQRDGRDTLCQRLSGLFGTGFVLCPFAEGEGHPVVLVRADVTACGWEDIGRLLQKMVRELHLSHATLPQSMSVPTFADLKARLFESRPDSGYEGALSVFLHDLQEGRFNKLVLSRAQNFPGAHSAARIFARACHAYPNALVTLSHTRSGTWIGASPEILLQGEKDQRQTMALAGTRPRGSATPWDEKNRREQAWVARYIRDSLAPLCARIRGEGPFTAEAGQVEHLRTDFFLEKAQGVSFRDLALALHPTPAVCGLPKKEAMERILSTESLDRRYYSGFIGLMQEDAASFYVNLRCLKLHAGGVRLYAGGGILAQSKLESEWKETCHKMCTMLALIGRDEA